MIVNYGISPMNAMMVQKIIEFSAFKCSIIFRYDLMRPSKLIKDMIPKEAKYMDSLDLS